MNARIATAIASLTAFLVLAPACAKPEAYLRHGSIHSKAMGRPMDFAAFVPRDIREGRRVPLILFLHGGGDDHTAFDAVALGQALDEEVSAGRLPPFVLVLPDGELGFWENWYDGSFRYADWVLDDLLPYVYATLPAEHCPETCAVMGVSMGGHGALRFALARPETFDAVAAISAPIFSSDQMIEFSKGFVAKFLFQTRRVFGPATEEDRERIGADDLYLRWTSPDDVEGFRLFFAWGTGDREGIVSANESFTAHLEESGIAYSSIVYDGQHKWVDWKPVIIELLRQILLPEPEATAAQP